MLIALMVFRRWRHLLTFLGSLAILEWASSSLYDSFARPRPYGVTIIGRWAGYSLPSPPVAALAAVLVGIIYTLVVPGRPRTIGKYTIGVIIAAFAAGPALPGRRPPTRRRHWRRPRHRRTAHRLPTVHPEHRLPRELPAGARPPTSM